MRIRRACPLDFCGPEPGAKRHVFQLEDETKSRRRGSVPTGMAWLARDREKQMATCIGAVFRFIDYGEFGFRSPRSQCKAGQPTSRAANPEKLRLRRHSPAG